MNQRIIYSTDSGVSIIIPTPEALQTLTIDDIAKKDVPAGVAYKIVDTTDIPTDRTFRNAWKDDLTVDMPKAQEITKDRLRAERTPLLLAQDVAYSRATETGADTTAIVAEKNRLRDVTKLVDTVATLEELKALTP